MNASFNTYLIRRRTERHGLLTRMCRRFMNMRRALAAAALLATAFFALPVAAQAPPPKPFTLGDVYLDRNGDTVQVIRCKGAGWQTECQLRRLKESGKAPFDPSAPRWWDLNVLRGSERSWTEFQGHAPYAGPPVPLPAMAEPSNAGAAPPAIDTPHRAATGAATMVSQPSSTAAPTTEECPRTPYGGSVPGNTAASEALFKRKIADTYTMATRAPYWYGVTFEKFTLDRTQRNVVTNVPGRGATRVNEGAPPNATMHPVSSVHVVCEQSPGQASRRRVESRYLCFVSANNEWTCGGDGVPTITRFRGP